MRGRWLREFAGLCALALPVHAQDIVFRSGTQLVSLNVTAKDKNGKPVEGLKASDFTVLEDGKPQKLTVFEYQKLDGSAPAGILETDSSSAPAPGQVRYQDRRLLAIFLDQSSMPDAQFFRVRDAALKFVREQLDPHDAVAVLSFTTKLEVLQQFTADRDQLERVIATLAPYLQDEEVDDAEAEFSVFNTDQKLGALADAVRLLGSLSERKALIYFSAGSGGGTGPENQSQLRSTINAAVRHNVVIYPVDARGLSAQAPMGNASAASPGGAAVFSGQAMLASAQQLGGEDESLYRLAKETGGKALIHTNDLTLGLREAQKDFSSYYILGYYSGNTEPDGKLRQIKIEIDRKLAVNLDYRRGYYVSKRFQQLTAADRERQLQEALTLGDPMTEIRVALEVNYFQTERNRYLVPLSVKIPGTAVEFPANGSGARLDFIAQVKNATGAVSATVRDNLEIGADESSSLASRMIHYDTLFQLAPGPYSLKFITRENVSGKMGTFETSFFVPDLATELDYLPMSSVILSSHRETVSGVQTKHPLVRNGEKLVPSVTRVFRRGQQMYLYLESYAGAATSVRLAFYSGNRKILESEPQDTSGSLQLSVALDTLPPGRYTCQVSLVSPQAQKFAFWRAPILILP